MALSASAGATTTQFIDTWHVRDHLGSVRTVLDITRDTSEVSDEHRLYYIDSEGNRGDNYITVNNRKILDAFTGKDGMASYTGDSNASLS